MSSHEFFGNIFISSFLAEHIRATASDELEVAAHS